MSVPQDYTPKHLKLSPLTIGGGTVDVVCCLHCGASDTLSNNEVLHGDELRDFVDAHTDCPPPAA